MKCRILFSGENKKKLECAVDGTPSQIPMLVANSMTDGLAFPHTYHEGMSCSKFG